MALKQISILGVGLLGGSIGLAAKSAISDVKIIGYGHRSTTLQRALEIGAIDVAAENVAEAAAGADLVILCTPVGIFGRLVGEMKGALEPGAVVTDVGSTKRSVVGVAEAELPQTAHFVGSHPMAGSEKRGVEYARADLFAGATCILTPTARTDADALAAVDSFWKTLGMRTTMLSPQDHDKLLAEVSHLPHAVAAALVAMQGEEGLGLAGKGFLDTTRIAGGDGGLWRDIFIDNRDNLLDSIGLLRGHLAELEGLLKEGKGEDLAAWLDRAAKRRAELVQRKLGEMNE